MKFWLFLLFVSLISLSSRANPNPYLSIKLESERAFEIGSKYLRSQQQEQGHWGDPKTPAITALTVSAILRNPNFNHQEPLPEWLQKAYQFLRSKQKEDGGIYGKGLATYNTSTSIMAFIALGDSQDEALLLKAREFLINQQTDWGNKAESDNQYDGGIGYGGTYAHSDMSNTYLALEALFHTKQLAADSAKGEKPKLNWQAALQFISRCQNLPESNDLPYASADKDNKGGFIYFPNNSKAGEQKLPDGTTALRSYGSMSYAGLLSFIYADLEKEDPRIVAVLDWISRHYTLEENPRLGQQGLYYYYHTLSKSLSAAAIESVTLADGKKADWRGELTRKLLSTQREDGSWVNSNSRWWENDPVLVTAYALLSLAQLHAVM